MTIIQFIKDFASKGYQLRYLYGERDRRTWMMLTPSGVYCGKVLELPYSKVAT